MQRFFSLASTRESTRATPRATPGRALLGALLAPLLCFALASPAALGAETQDKAQLQKQLDEARGRLDDAARDVADLSRQLYGDEMGVMPGPGGPPRGAMLGVNIGGGSDRAEGVEVMGVSPSGPAEAAGIRKGDIIVALDGKALRKTDERNAGRQLVEQLHSMQPGQKVKVDYLRDGKRASATLTTAAAEPPMLRMLREHMPMLESMRLPREFDPMHSAGGFRALELVPVTPRLGQYFGTDKGLLVVKAPPASTPGLEEGDVILAIGGRTPENPRHAFRILGSYEPKEKVKVDVLRQRKRMTLDVTMPDAGMMGAPPPRPGFAPPPPPAPPRGKAGIAS